MSKRPGKAQRLEARRKWQGKIENIQKQVTLNLSLGLGHAREERKVGGFKLPSYEFKSKTHKQPYIPYHAQSVKGKVSRGKIIPSKPKTTTADKQHYLNGNEIQHMRPVYRVVINPDTGEPERNPNTGGYVYEVDYVAIDRDEYNTRGQDQDKHNMVRTGTTKRGPHYDIVGDPDSRPKDGGKGTSKK